MFMMNKILMFDGSDTYKLYKEYALSPKFMLVLAEIKQTFKF